MRGLSVHIAPRADCVSNQLRLLLRLGFALRFGEWICLWWRVNTLCLIHQIFDREDLDFGIGTTIDRTR